MICTREDTKLINEIMRDFTNITKIAAIFVNNRGKVLSQEYNFSHFCKVVRRNQAYDKRCNQCDLYGGLDATKELSSCPYPVSYTHLDVYKRQTDFKQSQ